MKLAILASALTIVAIPAASAEPYVVYGNVNSVDVYTGDLNLNDPRDRDEAAYRINIATDAACKPFPDIRVLQEFKDWRGCRAEAFDDGIAQIEGRPLRHRRGHVTTREYQEPPPPPPEDDDED